MSTQSTISLQPLAPGIILALVSILFGFALGGIFGAAEDQLKGRLRASADAVIDTVYDQDEERSRSVVGRSWSYLKRAHMHGGAIGTAALASIVLLGLLGRIGRLERLTSWAFGLGAVLYSFFWLAAGLKAPGMGGTSAAKEALNFLAIPGAALSLFGVVGTMVSVVQQLILGRDSSS